MALHANNDLLANGLGSKNKGSEESSSPSTQAEGSALIGNTSHDKRTAGTDIIASAGNKVEKQESEKDSVSTSSSDANTAAVSDPNTWTTENALKELKKAREEAKSTRLKYQEMVKAKEAEYQAQLAAEEQRYKDAIAAQKELEEVKAKEADKKRSLEEKLSHREKMLAEYEARLSSVEKTSKQQLEAAEARIKELNADREAQLTVYKERLNEELAKIPQDKRDIADLMVKGAGDARDALIALNEAKLKGIFEDKKVVVNHSVPGASSGARVSQSQLEEAEKERRASMTSTQKIKEGLKKSNIRTPQKSKNLI